MSQVEFEMMNVQIGRVCVQFRQEPTNHLDSGPILGRLVKRG